MGLAVAELRLGKQEYKFDHRTARLGEFLSVPDYHVPNVWDLDKGRSPMPLGLFGNDKWGDCVLVTRANQVIRMERLDTRRTVPITTEMVVDTYKQMTGAQTPHDGSDRGLVMLNANSAWRGGWELPLGKKGRKLTIDAYGELNAKDRVELRAGAFLLGGLQFGLALPLTAADQIRAGKPWDTTPSDSGRDRPSTWGGHAVYSKRFDENGFWVVTWGREQYMTNAFIEAYADEVWAVVDTITGKRYLDQQKLRDYLTSLTG